MYVRACIYIVCVCIALSGHTTSFELRSRRERDREHVNFACLRVCPISSAKLVFEQRRLPKHVVHLGHLRYVPLRDVIVKKAHVDLHVHVDVYSCACGCMYVCMCAYVHVNVYIHWKCMCARVCTSVFMYLCIYVFMCSTSRIVFVCS